MTESVMMAAQKCGGNVEKLRCMSQMEQGCDLLPFLEGGESW